LFGAAPLERSIAPLEHSIGIYIFGLGSIRREGKLKSRGRGDAARPVGF